MTDFQDGDVPTCDDDRLSDPTPISGRIVVRFFAADEVVLPVLTDLRYESADPYAVTMKFHVYGNHTVQWVLGRELLMSGQHRPTGAGDVHVWPSPHLDPDTVCISLRSKGKAVVLAARAQSLDAFLKKTLAAVPLGSEEQHLDMDGIARQLLERPW